MSEINSNVTISSDLRRVQGDLAINPFDLIILETEDQKNCYIDAIKALYESGEKKYCDFLTDEERFMPVKLFHMEQRT